MCGYDEKSMKVMCKTVKVPLNQSMNALHLTTCWRIEFQKENRTALDCEVVVKVVWLQLLLGGVQFQGANPLMRLALNFNVDLS